MSDFLIQLANFAALSVPIIMIGLVAYQVLSKNRDKDSDQSSDEVEQ